MAVLVVFTKSIATWFQDFRNSCKLIKKLLNEKSFVAQQTNITVLQEVVKIRIYVLYE